ncbi:MAG: hypothetical protein HQ508_07440 [Candidatus Marinimicrobia bacterium]|nr:hypothetical protein [Candidatus Neomarinimicrobiota bacterium]
MRYLLLIAVAYFVFKSVVKMLGNLKIVDSDSAEIKNSPTEPASRIKVDESDIEDADFKELD